MKNIFGLDVGYKAGTATAAQAQSAADLMSGQAYASGIIRYLLMGIMVFGAIGAAYYILLESKKKREMRKSEARFWKNLK